MQNPDKVKKNEDNRLEQDWCNKFKLADAYIKLKDEFSQMFFDFASICHGYLSRAISQKSKPNHLRQTQLKIILHCTGGSDSTRVSKKPWWKKMLENITRPAQTGETAVILFAPKKKGTISFCVEYRKLNGRTSSDVYMIPYMKNVFFPSAKPQSYLG